MTIKELTSSQSMRVVEADPHADPRWERFGSQHEHGSIYHHPSWIRALEMEYGQKGLHFACEDTSGKILAVMPTLPTRGLPLNLGGPLAGSRLSSLPRTPLGGPLSTEERATVAVLRAAVRASQNKGVQLQIKTQGPELAGLVDGLVGTPWRLSYVLRLPSDSEQPFQIANNRNRRGVEWTIKKATKLGVSVRRAEAEIELRDWYTLYVESMRRNGILARPYRFFADLWKLQSQGMMELLLAERVEAGRRRIVAGSIFLMFGRTVSYAFSGAREADLWLGSNDVIQWRAINDACSRGFRLFDFGEVPEGHKGLARFKSKWGAEPVALHRYYYPNPPGAKAAGDDPGYATVLKDAIWRRLPRACTVWLSDRLYKYLSLVGLLMPNMDFS